MCFSSDCFGGPLTGADLAEGDDVGALDPEDLRAAQLLWASVDSPWVQNVDVGRFLDSFRPLRDREPELILSTHLPPAQGITGSMIDTLSSAAGSSPFVGPDQAALEQMLAGFEPSGGGHGGGH